LSYAKVTHELVPMLPVAALLNKFFVHGLDSYHHR